MLPAAILNTKGAMTQLPDSRKSADASGSERRRERRYQLDLPATARSGVGRKAAHAVMVSDLSASGALISVQEPGRRFEAGERITLSLDGFGAVEAQVAHVGSAFYGLHFLHAHPHQDRLATWLQEDVAAA